MHEYQPIKRPNSLAPGAKPKSALQRTAINDLPSEGVPPMVEEVLASPGQALDSSTRSDLEPRFGQDFSQVKIHTDELADSSARSVNAWAFTVGNHLVFGDGQYAPNTSSGRQLLTHELAHVVQQTGPNPIAPRLQARSRATEMDDLLEWWDSSSDAVQALNLLSGMAPTDFNDTLNEMVKSRQIVRFINRLPGRAEVVRFLKLLGDQGTRPTQEAVMNSDPMFNLGPENQMIVFGRQFGAGFGAANPAPSAALKNSLISSDPSAPFTGSGATGIRPDQAPIGLGEMWDLRSQSKEAIKKFGPDGIEYAQYHKTPGMEMLYDWSNPIKGGLVGPGTYLAGLTPAQRKGQAEVLLNQPISTNSPAAYQGGLPSRAQVIRAAANMHRLEPQLVAAIILAEQRDQSKREDAADYKGATMGKRSTSIGLGQVTIRTARTENLFADVASPSMQKTLGLNTDMTNNMIAGLLASDDFNIYAVARYLRIVADLGATKTIASLPNTQAWVGAINLALYSQPSSAWTPEHVKLIGSEYTSKPFDDKLREGWGEFVLEAYNDVRASGIF